MELAREILVVCLYIAYIKQSGEITLLNEIVLTNVEKLLTSRLGLFGSGSNLIYLRIFLNDMRW